MCDVLRVLQEERAQCVQELSKEKAGELGLETVTGRRPLSAQGHSAVPYPVIWGEWLVLRTKWAVQGRSGFVHSICCQIGYMVSVDLETSYFLSLDSQRFLAICFCTHSLSR